MCFKIKFLHISVHSVSAESELYLSQTACTTQRISSSVTG